MITTVYDNFKLPIQYNKETRKILDNLDADLELTKKNVGSEISVYEKIIQPETCFGNECIVPFSKFYTSDIEYIQDTQNICKNITSINIDKPVIEDTWKNYDSIKNDADFLDKYQYIDWTYFKWLNTISFFLLVLSLYNLSSPLFNLLSPLFVLIVPFFMLKFMGIPVTMNSYYGVLLQQLKKHAIGQLFTQWNNVDATKKIYLLFCFGMYFYNIYQNMVSCRRFYRNSHHITKTFNQIKNYLDYTIENMEYFSKIIQPHKTYESFKNNLDENKEKLISYYNDFNSIPDKVVSLKNIPYLGKTMKSFYTIYSSSDFHSTLEYSFAFNGYLDVLKGINNKINSKVINPIKLLKNNKSKLEFNDFYHPLIDKKPVKNYINLKKNKIITGPNASGKTTLLKSSIINILICQQFGYGFFSSGKMTTFHNIYCYMNIPDTNGRDSLFQAEARRCLEILRKMDERKNERHFAVFDELYSGTNPYEAISSAYSYLNYISKNKNIKFILTTHFIKLCELLKENKKVQNCCMDTIVYKDNPQYKYKIIKGISKIKGGVCVLKNLNYPDDIIKNTKAILETI